MSSDGDSFCQLGHTNIFRVEGEISPGTWPPPAARCLTSSEMNFHNEKNMSCLLLRRRWYGTGWFKMHVDTLRTRYIYTMSKIKIILVEKFPNCVTVDFKRNLS